MTLIKFKPNAARELLRDSIVPGHFFNVFDSMLNEQVGKFERNVFFTPRTDVMENAEIFEIQMTLPGLKKDEIKIELEGDVLTINGERKLKNDSKEAKYHVVESFYGKFTRSFTLPENVNKEKVDATLEEGILRLSIPKMEVKENKASISIK